MKMQIIFLLLEFKPQIRGDAKTGNDLSVITSLRLCVFAVQFLQPAPPVPDPDNENYVPCSPNRKS
jgi:hypothetical protein